MRILTRSPLRTSIERAVWSILNQKSRYEMSAPSKCRAAFAGDCAAQRSTMRERSIVGLARFVQRFAPDPVEVTIAFEGGIPVGLDGERLDPVDLVDRLHALAGAHGVGRIDHVEDRLVGIKSREIYEAPAATVLHRAHRALEGLTLTKDTLRFNRTVADELAQLTYDGLWFSALHRDLRAYAASSQRVVSGDVRMRLDHGSAVVVGRRSPLSLYDRNLATYDEGDAFDHASAVGFIEIFGLPLRVEAARHGAVGRHHGAAWTWTEPLLEGLPATVSEAEPTGATG